MVEPPCRRRTAPAILRSAFLLALLVVGPAACAAATPLCDVANRQLDGAQLNLATATFASAAQQGEGDCAQSGLAAAEERYKDAYVAVARGLAAETARDTNAATAAYQAALTFDVDNGAAREALTRLQQPVPVFREPDAVPPRPTEPRSGLVVALSITAVGLLCLLIGLLIWAVWRWRGQSADRRREESSARDRLTTILGELKGVDAHVVTSKSELVESLTTVAQACRRDQTQQENTSREVLAAIASARSDLEQARVHLATSAKGHAIGLERHMDDLTGLLARSAMGQGWPTLSQFVRAEADRIDHGSEGHGNDVDEDDNYEDDNYEDEELESVNVDVLLFSVACDVDGQAYRLALRRTAYVELHDRVEASVEELWISEDHPSQASVARAVRALSPVGILLILGRAVAAVPGMALATHGVIAETASMAAESDDQIELLLVFRGQVCDLTAEPWLDAAAISAAPTSLGQVARELIMGMIADLQLRPDDSGRVAASRVPRLALSSDLCDARTRLEQQELWTRIEGARLAFAEPTDTAADELWSRWERYTADGAAIRVDTGAGPAPEPAPDAIAAVLIGVEGGQVGEHNNQINLFRYRLEPTIDLHAVFGGSEVRSALARFAVSRGDPAELESAIDAIRAVRTDVHTDWARGERRIDSLPSASRGVVSWLMGTVVLCDCRGIQVGNHLRQYNTFTFVLAPTLDAHKLFIDHPDLVETIVDYACGGYGRTDQTMQDRLAEAVCGSADIELERASGSSQHPYGSTVRDEVGQSVGRDIRQSDVLDLVAGISDVTVRAVQSARGRAEAEAREAERAEAAARAEAGHDEAARDVESSELTSYFEIPELDVDEPDEDYPEL